MGERIAALAALSRIRALVEQIPTQAASPAQAPIEVQEAAVPQSAQAITASRPLQELAGLRQMAETTSQSTSPNINAQRVDRLGAALSRLAESTVDPPNAIEPASPASPTSRPQSIVLSIARLSAPRGAGRAGAAPCSDCPAR